MGLFDKLVKGIASEIKDEVKKAFNQQSEQTSTYSEPVSVGEPAPSASAEKPVARSWGKGRHNILAESSTYFSFIINKADFSGYTVETDVHPNVFDPSAHPKCFPITYLFKKDGEPVLAVLLMFRDQYRAMIAKGTYEVLDSRGIKYLRFYREMSNEESYVIDRIKDNLI